MNDLVSFEQKVRRARKIGWTIAIVCPLVGIGVVWSEYHYVLWPGRPCHDITPVLSGPAQFAVLTLIVALAAYLRAIRNGALELRDRIRQGEVKHYPIDAARFAFSRRKMDALDQVVNNMSIAGPFFIWLIIAVTIRISVETFLKLESLNPQCNRGLLIADTIIVLWMFIGIAALAIAHFYARSKDEKIRIAARREEDSAVDFSQQNSDSSAEKSPSAP